MKKYISSKYRVLAALLVILNPDVLKASALEK